MPVDITWKGGFGEIANLYKKLTVTFLSTNSKVDIERASIFRLYYKYNANTFYVIL